MITPIPRRSLMAVLAAAAVAVTVATAAGAYWLAGKAGSSARGPYDPAIHEPAIAAGQFDIRVYGALGNGVHDDTSGIAAALAAARSAGGGHVRIPAGTYLVKTAGESALRLPSNTEVSGDGPSSIVRVASDAGVYRSVFEADDEAQDIAVSNFQVDQNAAGNRRAAVTYDETAQVAVTAHQVRSFQVTGMLFEGAAGPWAVLVDGASDGVKIAGNRFHFVNAFPDRQSEFRDYDTSMVYVPDGRNVLIAGNRFYGELEDWPRTAIEVCGGPAIVVEHNTVDSFFAGVLGVNALSSSEDRPSTGLDIRENTITHAMWAVSLWSVTGRTLRDVRIRQNDISVVPSRPADLGYHVHGIMTYLGQDEADTGPAGPGSPVDPETYRGGIAQIEVADNSVVFMPGRGASPSVTDDGVVSSGISFDQRGPADGLVIRGNRIVSPPAAGIHVGNAAYNTRTRNVTIERNTIVRPGSDTTAPAEYRRSIVLSGDVTSIGKRSNSVRG